MARYIGWWSFLGFGYWAVEERGSGAFVGDLGFMDALRDIEPSIVGLPEAGWVFAPKFHGRGYASEALDAALAWVDATHAAPRTAALIAAENAPSLALAKKFGYAEATTIDFAGVTTGVFYRVRGARPDATH